jgi:hypothetical protein
MLLKTSYSTKFNKNNSLIVSLYSTTSSNSRLATTTTNKRSLDHLRSSRVKTKLEIIFMSTSTKERA